MKRIELKSNELIESPLWWQEQGLMETPTGYGPKLRTTWKVIHDKKLKRIYAACFSNVSTLYIMSKGERVIVEIMDIP